jgi:hypothetical protein
MIFSNLISSAPGDLPAAVWYQEADLAWRQERTGRFGSRRDELRSVQDELRDDASESAESSPSPLAYFLAARLEEDGLAANRLLEKALVLDPEMVWAHYGLAYGAARDGDWIAARGHLEHVFALDSGHLPSLRLHGWLVAEAGDIPSAIEALETWVDAAPDDLLAGQRTLDRVRFDLALAYTGNGAPGRSLDLLDQLEGSTIPTVQLKTARAVAQQDQGNPVAARSAALAGRRADRSAVLPAVQNALLLELWFDDKKAARRAWQEVIDLANQGDDLASGLQLFRAQVHLQRLQRAGYGGTRVR